MASKVEADVQHDWDTFWAPIVAPKGRINRQQVMRELFDFHQMIQNVSKVYDHVTGGAISKPNAPAHVVITAATDYDNEVLEDILRDEKEAWESDQDDSTCHVSVRQIKDDGTMFALTVLVPEGRFRGTVYHKMGLPETQVEYQGEDFPEDWKDTVLDAVKELLKED